jgi:uncharacterized protein YigE (DUF2233 family)
LAVTRLAIALLLLATGCGAPAPGPGWETIEDGLDFRSFAGCGTGASDAGSVHVVRADPARFRLTLLAASAQPGGRALPVTRWAADHDLVVATNAGMYHPDFVRHVGLMVDRGHENNPVAVSDYKSVLAFHPKRDGLDEFLFADLEETTLESLRQDYHTLIQNLRMISHRRANVWSPSDRRASTVALGVDSSGRLLFLFAGAGCSVHELNELLLRLPLDLARAQYLEGGPEASLFASAGGRTLGWSGAMPSAEPAGDAFWPVPNVIGLLRAEPSP